MSVKKILWASRHLPDCAAMARLALLCCRDSGSDGSACPGDCTQYGCTKHFQVEEKEILWPAEWKACRDLALDLCNTYDVVAGVFPAQAIEALRNAVDYDGDGPRPERKIILSPVSVPETEPDVKKTRPFRFVRWARVA
jgi:hypothetical protein